MRVFRHRRPLPTPAPPPRTEPHRRVTHPVTYESRTVAEWADSIGVPEDSLRRFVRREGWHAFFADTPAVQRELVAQYARNQKLTPLRPLRQDKEK